MDYFLIRSSCPVCGSKFGRTLFSCRFTEPPIRGYLEGFYKDQGDIEFQYLENASYILEECSFCGLIYQKQIPSDFLAEKLYTQWINPERVFESNVEGNDLGYFADFACQIMTMVSFFKKRPAELKVLDYGSGWGLWARMARAFGCDVYALELSQKKTAYSKSCGINIIHEDALKDHHFDFINIDQFLEHISNPPEVLRRVVEILKTGGVTRVSVPEGRDIKRRLKVNDWSVDRWAKNSLNGISPLEHINCFQWQSMMVLGRNAGLESIRMPLGLQYRFGASPMSLKSLLKPLYVNFFKKGTCQFFKKTARF